MHYNSSVAEHWTIFSYALYVVCMYFVSLIQLLLPNQINHYYMFLRVFGLGLGWWSNEPK